MATTEIYLDLSKVDKWLTADNDNGALSSSYEQKQDNLPRVAWSIDVMPFSNGVKSATLGNPIIIPTLLPSANDFSNLWEIRSLLDSKGNLTYLMLDDSVEAGTVRQFKYWYNGMWRLLVEDVVGIYHFIHRKTTVFQNTTLFMFTPDDVYGPGLILGGDPATSPSVFSLDIVAGRVEIYNLTGILFNSSNRKNGITSFQNYLIFWSATRMFWSSPTDFKDFTPSLGGGGSTQISEAKGDIITIVPTSNGLMIYCKLNIIHASFSGDSTNPWIFREVPNSGGVLMELGNPLVTVSESTEFQVYMGHGGIQLVAENGAKALDPEALEFLNNNSVELKPVGSVDITSKPYDKTGTKAPSKVRDLILQGNLLFIFVGTSTPSIAQLSDNRLYVYDLSTGKIGKYEGDYHSCHPHLNLLKDIDSGADLHNKVDAFPAEFILGRRYDTTPSRAAILFNFGDGIERQAATGLPAALSAQLRTPELLLGPISLRRSKSTIIQSIQLDGDIEKLGEPLTRVTVRVYSKSTMGATNPIPFTYNPLDGRFYGYAEGKDLHIEIRGNHFYLTGVAVEVTQGGIF
jgi:hypothetical protein